MNGPQKLTRALGLVLVISAAAAMPAWAANLQSDHGAHGASGKPAVQIAPTDMTNGEVRKVDKEGGKLTLKHAEIKSLDMPPMTMVFAVRDKAMLDKFKAGDKIKFKAISDAGKYTVTEIQVAQ
jgi:Cu(I)/Ag(I) efflux system protein CusF